MRIFYYKTKIKRNFIFIFIALIVGCAEDDLSSTSTTSIYSPKSNEVLSPEGDFVKVKYLGATTYMLKKGDNYILGGDVIISKDEVEEVETISENYFKNLAKLPLPKVERSNIKPFPSRNLKIGIDPSFTIIQRNLIVEAIIEYNQKTLLYLESVEYNATNCDIKIKRLDSGCSADGLGYRSSNPRMIKLGPKCDKISILHEIGHALGRVHTHQRQDRDQFITMKENAFDYVKEKYPKKYNDLIDATYDIDISSMEEGSSFDISSIMMYSSFLKNAIYRQELIDKSLPLFTDKSGNPVPRPQELTNTDVEIIDKFYRNVPDDFMRVYKLDSRPPNGSNGVFSTGFKSFGDNTNLGDHVTGYSILDNSSAFISTSVKESEVLKYMQVYKNTLNKKGETPPEKLYIYSIRANDGFFNTYKTITSLNDYAAFPQFFRDLVKNQEEWVALNKITYHFINSVQIYNYDHSTKQYVDGRILGNTSFFHNKTTGNPSPYGNFDINHASNLSIEDPTSSDEVGVNFSFESSYFNRTNTKLTSLLFGPYSTDCSYGGFFAGRVDCNFKSNGKLAGKFGGVLGGGVFGGGRAWGNNVWFRRPVSTLVSERVSNVHFSIGVVTLYVEIRFQSSNVMNGAIQLGGFTGLPVFGGGTNGYFHY